MVGGAGNDVYYVDTLGNLTIELRNPGTDLVVASLNWTLAANVENLTLTGAGNPNGTGNGLGNRITGNAGNNLLDGGAGIGRPAGGRAG